MSKLVYGVGINDAGYVTQRGSWKCSYYQKWQNMLKRCYSSRTQAKYPSYKGCTVCTEWLTFSNFKKWLTECSGLSLQLDKDLLVEGNKVYSPETCVMISGVTCRKGW